MSRPCSIRAGAICILLASGCSGPAAESPGRPDGPAPTPAPARIAAPPAESEPAPVPESPVETAPESPDETAPEIEPEPPRLSPEAQQIHDMRTKITAKRTWFGASKDVTRWVEEEDEEGLALLVEATERCIRPAIETFSMVVRSACPGFPDKSRCAIPPPVQERMLDALARCGAEAVPRADWYATPNLRYLCGRTAQMMLRSYQPFHITQPDQERRGIAALNERLRAMGRPAIEAPELEPPPPAPPGKHAAWVVRRVHDMSREGPEQRVGAEWLDGLEGQRFDPSVELLRLWTLARQQPDYAFFARVIRYNEVPGSVLYFEARRQPPTKWSPRIVNWKYPGGAGTVKPEQEELDGLDLARELRGLVKAWRESKGGEEVFGFLIQWNQSTVFDWRCD